MKKLLLTLCAAAVSFAAVADEGMWLLPYLKKMNIEDMQKMGLELTAEDIYSVDESSLKDAIIIFGGGCTGEIVSPNGLIFTNHHCGYGSIQALSSVGADYLKDGYWAMSNEEELPAAGLSVKFIRQIVDVTPEIVGNIPSIAQESERNAIVVKNIEALKKEYQKKNKGMIVGVTHFFGGNQYFLFVMEQYNDVRLVGTPPTSIGKFGGETDNWMWPRHTGDFSIFRVYADKDNRPASYSPDNVPYQAEKFLKISTAGTEVGDFAMIMGFPGSTQRFMTSFEIDYMLEVTNPQRIAIRGERQDILMEDMMASDKVRIQYASKYASSSNYWKNAIGMSRGLKKLNVKAQKEAQEASYQSWAAVNTLPQERLMDALSLIESGVKEGWDAGSAYEYLSEAILRAVEINSIANSASRIAGDKKRVKADKFERTFASFYKDYNESTDRKVAKRMLELVKENVKDLPTIFADVIDAEFNGDIEAYVDYLYDNSVFASEQKADAFAQSYDLETLEADPAVRFSKSVMAKMSELGKSRKQSNAKIDEGQRLYIAGLMMQQPDKAWASDANFTIRLTYGQVLPYSPADGVLYEHQTTLKGVIEKEDPSNPVEFTVDDRLKEIYNTQDYGPYADKSGNMPVGFLSNLDITGGNSGSPIMNGRGELIGLAFDGNWEAMSGDVAFEPDLQRTISVDVRYVLMVIDKFAEAGWLLEEMEIVQ
ncbi:MAG: S46 family peptidase [Rikenellaceae bacterium]